MCVSNRQTQYVVLQILFNNHSKHRKLNVWVELNILFKMTLDYIRNHQTHVLAINLLRWRSVLFVMLLLLVLTATILGRVVSLTTSTPASSPAPAWTTTAPVTPTTPVATSSTSLASVGSYRSAIIAVGVVLLVLVWGITSVMLYCCNLLVLLFLITTVLVVVVTTSVIISVVTAASSAASTPAVVGTVVTTATSEVTAEVSAATPAAPATAPALGLALLVYAVFIDIGFVIRCVALAIALITAPNGSASTATPTSTSSRLVASLVWCIFATLYFDSVWPGHVCGLCHALFTLHNIEQYYLVVANRSKIFVLVVSGYGGLVDEYVLFSIVTVDEAVTIAYIEPLHFAGHSLNNHVFILSSRCIATGSVIIVSLKRLGGNGGVNQRHRILTLLLLLLDWCVHGHFRSWLVFRAYTGRCLSLYIFRPAYAQDRCFRVYLKLVKAYCGLFERGSPSPLMKKSDKSCDDVELFWSVYIYRRVECKYILLLLVDFVIVLD